MLRAGADRKFNGLLAPPPFPAGGPAVPGACGAPRMLRQPERPVARCSAVWTNVSAWPWRTPGAAGVTWGDRLGKDGLGRLGGDIDAARGFKIQKCKSRLSSRCSTLELSRQIPVPRRS